MKQFRDTWNKNEKSYNRTIKEDKEDPNIEAEKGETILASLNGDNIPEHYNIEGKKHSKGGTKLKVPEGSFVFSDFLKIKDEEILKMFGITDGKPRTFADIAKQYDINKYKKILLDDETTKMEKKTAESMIKKYDEKLGKLALIQESMKGFPDGLPDIAEAYLANSKVNIMDVFNELKIDNNPPLSNNTSIPTEQSKLGGENRKKYRIVGIGDNRKKYRVVGYKDGGLTKYQQKGEVKGKDNIDKAYDAVYSSMQNEAVKKEFIKRYRENIKNLKPGANLTQEDIEKMKKMSDDEIVRTFLYGEKRVQTFVKNNVVTTGWDKDTEAHNIEGEKLGLKKYSPSQTGTFQLGYETIKQMVEDDKLPKKVKDGMKNLDYFAIGPKHTDYTGRGENISVVDGYWGDDTAREYIGNKNDGVGSKPDDKNKDWKHLDIKDKKYPARFMTNDLINLYGAIGDREMLRQYLPWSERLNATPVSPSYTDFRSQAHRLNSGLRSMISAQSQFTGPNQIAGMANESAATLAENMANVTANEHQTNIAMSNEFNMNNAERLDKVNAANLEQKIKDYDNWVAMKDNFAMEKLNYKANVRNMLTNVISNRGYLQNINELHNNYKIMPDGTVRLIPDDKLNPGSAEKSAKERFAENYKFVADTFQIKDPEKIAQIADYMMDYDSDDKEQKRKKQKEDSDEALSWAKQFNS